MDFVQLPVSLASFESMTIPGRVAGLMEASVDWFLRAEIWVFSRAREPRISLISLEFSTSSLVVAKEVTPEAAPYKPFQKRSNGIVNRSD